MRRGRSTPFGSALRFARAWRAPPATIGRSEVLIPLPGGADPIPGTVLQPKGSPRRGWVVLHGMTRLGRAHPELERFVQALAAAGGTVLVPEIRQWIELDFAPPRAQRVLRAAVDWLAEQEGIEPGGVMLVGISFGAPQALFAASDPTIARKLRGVVGWGGYADIERTFRFSFTGAHEWEGMSYWQRPDPYSRWVIGANCLPLSAELGDHAGLVESLRRLAIAAGERRIQSWDPSSDPFKAELRRRLAPSERDLFDLFAPPAGVDPDPAGAEAVVRALVPAIREGIPLIEPLGQIDRILVPVRLLHARSDYLIPFSETLRLAKGLGPRATSLTTRLTGLFSHSGDSTGGSLWMRGRENLRFLGALRGIFEVAHGPPA